MGSRSVIGETACVNRTTEQPRHHSRRERQDIYSIKIVLSEISPPVWRRVHITSDTSLPDLHLIIQSTMGWRNDGAHCFIKGPVKLKPRERNRRGEHAGGIPSVSYRDAKASHLFSVPGDRVLYTYSSGEGWSHLLIFEEIVAREKNAGYPRCVGGARACPPESCSGTIGYLCMLEALGNPCHPEHEFALNRYGAYDPDIFDKADINDRYLEENYGCF